MASIDRLNMLIRNYNERFPNATVDQMATYLRRNHPEEYKLFQRVGDVKQNIIKPNFTLGEGSALKYQNKPATNLPVRTTTGTNVVPYNNFDPMAVGKQQAELERITQEQAALNRLKAKQPFYYNPLNNNGISFEPTVEDDIARWNKLGGKTPNTLTQEQLKEQREFIRKEATSPKATSTAKTTPKGTSKLGVGGAILGTVMGLPSLFSLADKDKSLQDKALDAVQGIGGIVSPLTLAPHPIAKGIGWIGTAAATGLPVIRGALTNNNQEPIEPIQQQVQPQPVVQQPTQQIIEPAPQLQRVTNTPTEYQLPNINITTQPPQPTGDFYNRADIMQKELGAMTRGAAQNFNQVQAGPTPEQIQAYANILNLQNQQQDLRQDDIRKLQEAQLQDQKINAINNLATQLRGIDTRPPAASFNLYNWRGNTTDTINVDGRQPFSDNIKQVENPQRIDTNTQSVKAQIELQEQARQQQIKNAYEMAKIQDAIAVANATGMPINLALGLTGEDVLGYNKDVIQRQSDLLGKGIEGGYDIAQEAMEQEGSLAKEGYSQAGQNARTAANIQRDILKTQMDNVAAMERILQQGQNALSLAEYKARTGTTAGYEDYMKAMLSASWMMPEDMQMAVWNEAMRRQGIIPANNDGGYYQTDNLIDL